MSDVQTTYLGWTEPTHYEGCAKPQWDVDVRTEYDVYRRNVLAYGVKHSCPNEDCDHGGRVAEETTVRLVCWSCGRAHLLNSESGLESVSVRSLGYGLPPLKKAGLWLWPGEPLLKFEPDESPASYLVTRNRVGRVQREDVIGSISWGRTPRRREVWSAVAVPSADGLYGYGEIRWARGVKDLRSLAAAAKWIADQQAAGGGSA